MKVLIFFKCWNLIEVSESDLYIIFTLGFCILAELLDVSDSSIFCKCLISVWGENSLSIEKKKNTIIKIKKKDRMGEEALSSPKNKVKFLCSHGGKILPRPSDGQLKYVGGETRVVAVPRNITFPGKLFFLFFFPLLLSYGPVELKDIVHLHMVQMQFNS